MHEFLLTAAVHFTFITAYNCNYVCMYLYILCCEFTKVLNVKVYSNGTCKKVLGTHKN